MPDNVTVSRTEGGKGMLLPCNTSRSLVTTTQQSGKLLAFSSASCFGPTRTVRYPRRRSSGSSSCCLLAGHETTTNLLGNLLVDGGTGALGDLTKGNIQIHPEVPKSEEGICPPPNTECPASQ